MRKTGLFLAAAIVLANGMCAGAETVSPFDQIDGLSFRFSSGVGGWSTDLTIGENGIFTGEYHDSEMGDTGEGYPDGSVYVCSFSGQLSVVEQVDENTWRLRVERIKTE